MMNDRDGNLKMRSLVDKVEIFEEKRKVSLDEGP